jgi:immune inhibitor A
MQRSRYPTSWLWAAVVAAGTLAVGMPVAAQDGPDEDPGNPGGFNHDIPHPLGKERRAARQEAMKELLAGQTPSNGKVHQVASGLFVELERQSEDPIWTVLGEFGDFAPWGGIPGPLHNEIPEPPPEDNVTHWVEDFSPEHFEDMLFNDGPGANSMHNFYVEQSSGRYGVYGTVEDWVKVPYNGTVYGGPGEFSGTVWWFVEDTINGWYANQLAAGKTPAEIDEYLSQYDVWDRYDHDGDGDFDEPDGYIDHFQAVHSGEGEEAGGGVLGPDAIWSHRWYVQTTPIGAGGPSAVGYQVPFGGTQIGGSSYWIGDYTIEPENGGVGVFAHEFAHDHGLPDLYDTSGGDNSVQFWSLMSSGSWTSDGVDDIGTKPTHMGAWEKLMLGWLDYDVAFAGEKSRHTLGPAESMTKFAQALIVVLPNKVVGSNVGTPFAGDKMFYSGSGDNLFHTMTTTVTAAPGVTMSAKINYDIEADWDYAYTVACAAVGCYVLPNDVGTNDDPNGHGANYGWGITGNSGGWITVTTADLGGLPPGDYDVGFAYITDAYVMNPGITVDEVSITGYPVDGAEDGATNMALSGFTITDGNSTSEHFNAYIAEYRQYRGYDTALRTGPYNFGFTDQTFGLVEHFPYQDGLLISYWDDSFTDNNTSSHPGGGLILPIDAHPETLYTPFGFPWRSRVQTYDSTFGLEDTDEITLHLWSTPVTHPSLPAVSTFDDNNQYWNPETPLAGVQNPHTDTQIQVRATAALGTLMEVHVK